VVAQAAATIALGLLGASGVAKLVDPDPTTGAMRAARLPASNLLSRMLATAEVVAAVSALVFGGVAVLGAALLYAGFAVFTFSALTNRIPLQSCGCFGREDTPPTIAHVVFNTVSALALFALPIIGVGPVDWALPNPELALYGGFAVVGVAASYLLLTRLPQLMTAVRPR